MSVAAVRKEITKALTDLHLETKEVDAVVAKAQPKVSNVEAKELGALYETVTLRPGQPPPGVTVCFPVGPSADNGAVRALDAFFVAKGLPLGRNKGAVIDAIASTLQHVRLGTPLPRAPKAKSLIELDVNGQKAFVDVAKQHFFLKNDQGFFGPLALSLKKPDVDADATLSQGRKDKIMRRLDKMERAGTLQWTSGIPDFARGTKLHSEDLRVVTSPGGSSYSVLMSLGNPLVTGVVQNPNDVLDMYIVRRDGRGPQFFTKLHLDPRDV